MKNLTLIIISVILTGLTFGCGNSQTAQDETKWSVKMAEAVMARNDTLLKMDHPRIRWQYDVSFVGQAIDKLGDVDPKYSQYMEDWINYFVQEDGTVLHYRISEYNVDRINPAKNIITLYKRTGEQKYRKAIEKHVRQMETHPKSPSGGFWHKKIYPNQIWLDGLYMVGPFLAQYAREFNEPEWFDVVTSEIKLAYQLTLDEETGLLYHAIDESREERWSDPETGLSPHFWGRAMGWYMMAIVDVLDFLPRNHQDRDALIEILQNVSEAVMDVRDPETGLWFQVLDHGGVEGNYIEGSASAMFTYVFAKGAKNGYLDKKYLDIANESFDAILEHLIIVDEDGHITMTGIVGATGLGGNPYRDGSFEYYVNEKVIPNDPKGVAPFIIAALELNR
ncbi:glycoside hydrolase family 88/105 protein [Alkalitalea saponilacus]|uniref:Unsaturated rhamnogalacturonyl hydrolase n=1 Tax=Alkalitalea saponilacus TaxID=889453 RepID=A0A1T5HTT9_9BACT|nr:glycoside hydrolase family 88 protein [Alkalitalea saponilacus]ASB50188.1 glycosyl hydrolase family 88 [Alkalitalea saponilacus]SKC23961.1 unsaturated rhamnogalacturonyl hydrolase [Alkalitalea saponilacus]